VQNSGLAIVPLVVGAVTKDTTSYDPSADAGGYLYAEYFFCGCGIGGCIISIALIMTKDGKRLNQQNPDAMEGEDES